MAAGSLAAQSALRIPGARAVEIFSSTSGHDLTFLRKQALYALACACLLGVSRHVSVPRYDGGVAMVL